MPAWLIEGDPTVYLILAVVAGVCGALWWRTRRRGFAVAAGAAVLCIVGFGLLDRFFESDREQIERRCREMATAVQSRDIPGAFRYISDEFHYAGADKVRMRAFAEANAVRRNVTEMTVWGFDPGPIDRGRRAAEMTFLFKIRGNWGAGGEFFRCLSQWRLDPDGQWRLLTFDIYNPAVDSKAPMPVPELGLNR